MNNPAVDLLPACFRFSNMNMCSVFSFFHARFQRSDLVFWLYNSSLNIVFPQNVSTSSSGFEWHGQLFFQAQPRIAAYILHNVSRQSRAHNHRLLSALLNGPIDRAGLRLVSVLRDQNYLAVSPAEQVAALADFRSSPAAVAVPLVPSVVVTEDMQIALADDILARSARLALISEDADPALHAMAKNSLQVRLQRYSQWSTDLLAGPHLATPQSRSAGHSRSEPRSPPGLPPRMGAARHRIVGMATLSDESDFDAQQYLAASPDVHSSFSATDLRFLVSSSALPPIPCLGGWGPGLLFRSSAHREKAISELQQMDAVLDPVLFDLMSSNSIYAQKAQLVTLKWREIVSIGRATALWALLCLSETPPPDTLRATWLLQAIAAAQNLQPSDLVRYLDTLHLVVQNFDSVRGTFPLAFLHQLLSTLVLTALEKSGHPAMVALVQDWRRQYGSRVDVDMFAPFGTDLITIRPAHAKFNDVSQLLLDLQTLVLVAVPVPQKTLAFTVFPSASVSSRVRTAHRVQRAPLPGNAVVSTSPRGGTSSNSPRFLGRVPFQAGDMDTCWYCAGMLKTARAFFPDTAEKHASPAPARTADHPIRTCRKFKADMVDLARTFLKPVRSPKVFAAVVDFGDLPSDSEHSGDSDSFTCELESLN
jgi:hypothetical protein